MKKLLTLITVALTSSMATLGVVAGVARAQISEGLNKAGGASWANTSGDDLITNIINFLLFAVGIVAVIMLILGGFRYVTSNGDSNQVTAAKNTILYAIVGLVIAIFAYAIVNFVYKQIS